MASALIQAARNGKRVTVQIELQARFDEEANISYAEEMKKKDPTHFWGSWTQSAFQNLCGSSS